MSVAIVGFGALDVFDGAMTVGALVAFNMGVEAGQLTVIAAAFALVAYWRGNRALYRRTIVLPASIVISLIGSFWTLQRALG